MSNQDIESLQKRKHSATVKPKFTDEQHYSKSTGTQSGVPLFLRGAITATATQETVQRQAKEQNAAIEELTVAAPENEYEQEADRVSDQVLHIPESRVQRQAECSGGTVTCNEDGVIQSQATTTGSASSIQKTPSGFSSRLAVQKNGGTSLPASSRAYFEPRFEHDFSQVRIHDGPEAAELSQDINARAFTMDRHIFFAPNQFRPGQARGNRLLAHELTHVVQQSKRGTHAVYREPDTASPAKSAKSFDGARWFARFKAATTVSLANLGLAGENVILIQAIEDFQDIDDIAHPAHYNPNDRTIYFSYSGFRHQYNEHVIKKKDWPPERFESQIIEAALEEAFHAYQDAPRFRSSAFADFEKEVGLKLRKEFIRLIDNGVMDSYEKFKTYVPHFTKTYLPEDKVIAFLGENEPLDARSKAWQLSAREEIMNQWLHILEDSYFRARSMVSGLRGLGKKTPLPEEKKYQVSRIEKQAAGFARMKVDEIRLALRLKDLEIEKDPERRKTIETDIANLRTKLDWKTRIPTLEAEKKNLEKEYLALDPFKPAEHKRATEVFTQMTKVTEMLDNLYVLRDGVEAVMKKRGWLLPR